MKFSSKGLIKSYMLSQLIPTFMGSQVIAWPHVHPLTEKTIGGKIVNGTVAPKDSYPWFTSLLNTYSDPDGFNLCGGMLIAPDIVLTAAHCVAYGIDFVRIGALEPPFIPGGNGGQYFEEIGVTEVYSHPEYNTNTLDNDFAFLKLNISSNIAPAKIDGYADLSGNYLGGESLWLAGFGSNYYGGIASDVLMHVELGYVKNCTKPDNLYEPEWITENMICAEDYYKGSCFGDSGGPLIDKKQGVIVGLVSGAFGCAQPGYPTVFAKISAGFLWLQETICAVSETYPEFCDETDFPTLSPAPSKSPSPSAMASTSPSVRYCAENEEKLELKIVSDNFPTEINWFLSNDCNEELLINETRAMCTRVTQSENQVCEEVKTWSYCLDATKGYTFSITDSYGDGICCIEGNGYYTLTYGNFSAAGGQYETGESYQIASCDTGGECIDPYFKFKMKKPNGKKDWKTCNWVAEDPSMVRCNKNVKKTCPVICGTCDVCEDSPYKFKIKRGEEMKKKDCDWVAEPGKKDFRCSLDGAAQACRKTCGVCS